ncbi:Asr1405/Asl0597 family protein [Acaryochloris sp. IP29b_bin.137]|uniref:Asr1405/Asl0597 family protein n=1 Tax=Acaryochloris sp. IP29b_bin.137 TaxID=2969217 RepID=UPI00262C62AB|nr:Asr1405/Asl0597 family protein [Acaryochloris sp. IP29b_bin.137]
MNKSTSTVPEWGHIVSVHQGDRWSVKHRLQELKIPCACPSDGTLRVKVHHPLALVLVHSVVRRFTLSRQVGVDWLERCWGTKVACPNH